MSDKEHSEEIQNKKGADDSMEIQPSREGMVNSLGHLVRMTLM